MTVTPGNDLAVVKVCLSGNRDGINAVTVILAASPSIEISTGPDGPYPNRREPGGRTYLIIRVRPDAVTTGGAAHSHQAIRRPAAPSPKETQTRRRSHHAR
jgi:hypothetical protein